MRARTLCWRHSKLMAAPGGFVMTLPRAGRDSARADLHAPSEATGTAGDRVRFVERASFTPDRPKPTGPPEKGGPSQRPPPRLTNSPLVRCAQAADRRREVVSPGDESDTHQPRQ